MSRAGGQTFVYDNPPLIAAHQSVVGPKEGKGPLAAWFDTVLEDDLLGQKSWELAEMEMVRRCVQAALNEARLTDEEVQAMLGGDLNNQIIASSFAARALGVPFIGLYGACSTFAQALVVGSALISGGYLDNAVCAASSHYCTAERQFRFPLELGTQRPPQASWTATACGCALLKKDGNPGGLRVTCGTVGRIIDLNVSDANHMGAAMAPAVFDCIAAHLADMGRAGADYDLIATGDLGWIGRELLLELANAAGLDLPPDRLIDCGASLFYQEQDAHAGGSGCGCVASVACGWLMKRLEAGDIKRLLLVGSGAMFSPTSSQQAQSVPGIAYAACIERED
ncbi:MAG: stage V sporulation protein AD [Clostridia bacterium]|nr:stage V sporulation protein AD [Clostridia bacterium]